jgi:hydrogenase nickel incorporation protein HypA/HybF
VHELAVTRSILDTVLAHAEANGVRRILRIHLMIGELNEFRQEWIQRYFDYLSRDTLAEDARLVVEQVPAAFRCRDCDQDFVVSLREIERVGCPGCGGADLVLERGREFLIRDMEVE